MSASATVRAEYGCALSNTFATAKWRWMRARCSAFRLEQADASRSGSNSSATPARTGRGLLRVPRCLTPVNVEQATVGEELDDPRHVAGWNSRASPASAEAAVQRDERGADILGAVHDDFTGESFVIYAFVESVEEECRSMLRARDLRAHTVEPEARLVRVIQIAELRRREVARVLPVRDPGAQDDFLG